MSFPATESSGAAIRLTREAETTVVILDGGIDAGLREDAGQTMLQVLAEPTDLVIDAAGVESIDSSGMAFVLQLNRAVTEAGFDFCLRKPSAAFLELIEQVGMRDRVKIAS